MYGISGMSLSSSGTPSGMYSALARYPLSSDPSMFGGFCIGIPSCVTAYAYHEILDVFVCLHTYIYVFIVKGIHAS